MDEIQKTLVNQGRKDLAQKYYEKTSAKLPDKSSGKPGERRKEIDRRKKSEIRNIRRELSAYKKQLDNLSKLVMKHNKTDFDNVEVDNFFDSSTNGQIKDLIKKLDNADYELDMDVSKR